MRTRAWRTLMWHDRRSAVLARLYTSFTKNLNSVDLCTLMQCGVQPPRCFILDVGRAEVRRPETGELPWPVEFICALHRKHVFRGSCPPVSSIAFAVNQWHQRRRWHFHLKGSSTDSYAHLFDQGITPVCPHDPPVSVEAPWLEFREQIIMRSTMLRSREFGRSRQASPHCTVGLRSAVAWLPRCPTRTIAWFSHPRGALDTLIRSEMTRIGTYLPMRISYD